MIWILDLELPGRSRRRDSCHVRSPGGRSCSVQASPRGAGRAGGGAPGNLRPLGVVCLARRLPDSHPSVGTPPTESIPETTKVVERKIELVRDHHRMVPINLADVDSPRRRPRGNHVPGDHG